MTILLTGASGFIGNKLIEQLPSKDTVIFGRTKPGNVSQELFHEGEISSYSNYADIVKGVDTIIHLAARVHVMNDSSTNALELYREVNTYGTIQFAHQAASAGVKRFIFVSSIKVNGEETSLTTPFTSFDDRAPEDYYGQSKSEAEKALLELANNTEMEVVIIRPTLVYGPGAKANFASLLNLASKGLPLPFRCIDKNKRSLVSVTNLVDLITTCIEHPKAANQVFLVSDDNDLSTSEMVSEMSKALGKRTWQLPVPVWCYKLAGKLFRKNEIVDRLLGSLHVDITHTKETLNWTPPQTLKEGFKETAEEFLNSKKSSGKL